MVLTSQDQGKYLTKRWHEMRAKALKDQRDFTAAELAWLEVTNEPTIGPDNPDIYKVTIDPVDPNTTRRSKKYDLRDDPRFG